MAFRRITPAYAGTAIRLPGCGRVQRDHPRIRGNSYTASRMRPSSAGSPPHTREQQNTAEPSRKSCRITPAYAGTAISVSDINVISQDHPRIRGNSAMDTNTDRTCSGSPPHTREQLRAGPGTDLPDGITPAYAGTAWTSSLPDLQSEDHPRIRGNSRDSSSPITRPPGSPPHTREQLNDESEARLDNGITPAYAGTAGKPDGFFKITADHPRIRGNSPAECAAVRNPVGSPPHTREQRQHPGIGGFDGGITPAYAGTAGQGTGSKNGVQDHPRIRGNSASTPV